MLRVLVLLAAFGSVASGAPSEQQRAHAELVQVELPELRARQESANERQSAAARWFAGEGLLELAFPDLADAPLTDPLYLSGRLTVLQRRAEARAKERVAPFPVNLSSRDLRTAKAARDACLDAEDRADSLEHRMISGVRAGLEQHPGLAGPALVEARAQLRSVRPSEGESVDPAETGRDALALGEADAAFGRMARTVLRSFVIPDDRSLEAFLAADLAALTSELGALDGSALVVRTPVEEAVLRAQVARLNAGLSVMRPALAAQTMDLLQRWEWAELRGQIADLEATLAAETEASSEPQSGTDLSLDELTAQLAERTEAADEARRVQADEQAVMSAAGKVDTGDAFRLQIRLLEVQLAELRKTRTEDALQRVKRRAELGLAQTATDDQVAAAKAAAEAARARVAEAAAAGEEVDAEARLAEQIAGFREEYARLLSTGKSRHDRALEVTDTISKGLEEQRAAQAAARGLGPLDPRRQAELDRVYVAMRKLVQECRKEVARSEDALQQARSHQEQRSAALPDVGDPAEDASPQLEEWRDVVGEVRVELASQLEAASAELSASLGLLSDAKAARREAALEASTEARSLAKRTFFTELRQEVQEVGPMLLRTARELLALSQRLPSLIVDLSAIGAFIKGSFEFVLVLAGWLFLRSRAGTWATEVGDNAREVRPTDDHYLARVVQFIEARGIAGDWMELAPLLQPVSRRLVDVVTGLLVLKLLQGRVVALELLILGWTVVRTVLLAGGLVHLLVAIPGETRPGMIRSNRGNRDLAAASLRVLILWIGFTRLMERLTLELLDGDRMHDVVGGISLAFGWGLVFAALVVWAPAIQTALARVADDPFSIRLAKPSNTRIFRVPQAGVALVVLVGRSIARFGNQIIEGRGSLGWLRSVMARQSLRASADAPTEMLPAEIIEELSAFEDGRLGFAAERQKICEAFDAWKTEQRRGVIAVTGQRGSGKSRLMDTLPEWLNSGLPVRRAEMDRETIEPEAVLAWLMQSTAPEVERPAEGWTTDTCIEALSGLPPSLFVVDDLHRAFVRAVGGFKALRQVLTVMHAASDRHFWVCGFHGETWAWLEGVRGAVNLGVFRQRIRVDDLDEHRLRDWLEARARAAGLVLRYQHLAATGLRGTDKIRAEERARAAYWRLLVDSSRGNPRVSHSAWLTSLRQGAPGEAAVVLFAQPDSTVLEEAGDMALFLLAAIVVHDGLPVNLLANVLNISVPEVRTICRQLQGLGVLSGDAMDSYYQVVPAWSPVVDRRLRQRHLLHRV